MASRDTVAKPSDGRHDDDALSSPISTPLTTSPDSIPIQSLADRNMTPLSMFDDSVHLDRSHKTDRGAADADGGAGGGRSVLSSSQSSAAKGRASPTRSSAPCADAQDARDSTSDPRPASGLVAATSGDSEPCAAEEVPEFQRTGQTRWSQGGVYPVYDSNPLVNSSARNSTATVVRGPPQVPPQHEDSSATAQLTFAGNIAPASTASTSASVSPGHNNLSLEALGGPHDSGPVSFNQASSSSPPLRTASVQSHTQFSRPKPQPVPKPIVRSAFDSDALAIQHPTPDINAKSGAYVGNVAQLEATAERLSMTSSIDDAIRDLHGELKRSDSQRSSILAANLKSQSIDDCNSTTTASSVIDQLRRHGSISSSIVSTNNAARHGGYSPGGFVMSPTHSLTGRLRSGSKNSSGRPDFDTESVLSRHGPGKASVRSVRSTKMSLAEISESEPISLTQDILDKADSSPPSENAEHDALLPEELNDANVPTTDVFRGMMGDDQFMEHGHQDPAQSDLTTGLPPGDEQKRPGSSRSDTTFQQSQDIFGDFDGVHWEPEHEGDPRGPQEPDSPENEIPPAVPRPEHHALQRGARPQSYMDPESGQEMLYYPARVPAMLNLPPKLSHKPKASERNNRRSQVMSVMLEGNRKSRVIDRNSKAMGPDTKRDSWLPDPLAGHRESFAALSTDELAHLHLEPQPTHDSHELLPESDSKPSIQPEVAAPPETELRRPQKLSRMDPDKRASRMSRLDDLPPQLRASVYFEMPSTSVADVEVKDGSAMATLDSILDASANAPVSAFTDHTYAGKLGTEVYGKERKRASMAPSTLLEPDVAKQAKKRSSFMWLGRQKDHAEDEDARRSISDASGLGQINADTHASEGDALAPNDSERGSEYDEQQAAEEDAEDLPDEDGFQGPPTTLLAELQLRKQQAKQRTQRTFPGGMHATLLEMDAVAETQWKQRKDKRVNLAWEDTEGNLQEEASDDEDVPLAIIAARNQGAQNVMDLNRPIGLMEQREMEENEPLSHRRARLNGQDPRSLMIQNRPSMMNLSANNLSGSHLPPSSHAPNSAQEAEDASGDEFEGETLAERKRRLAAKDEAENPLPKARPVSSVFSAELLSQFGDLEEKKVEEKEKPKPAEEETLGERRRRLQAEREAREREMSFNQLVGPNDQGPQILKKRMSMADVLGAHPKREGDIRHQEERRRMEHENRLAQEREAKMAAMRSQMPTSLNGPSWDRSGGFRGGTFNDGTGGLGPQAAVSSPALHAQFQAAGAMNRVSVAPGPYGGAPFQQAGYGSMINLGAHNQNMGAYNGMGMQPQYGAGGLGLYNGGMMQPTMQMPVTGGSMARVEQWRQGVLP